MASAVCSGVREPRSGCLLLPEFWTKESFLSKKLTTEKMTMMVLVLNRA
jgi:hypothetical protein